VERRTFCADRVGRESAVVIATAQSALLSINNFHYRRAGSDALFMDHDRLFARNGWSTAVFSMRHADNEASAWERFFVEELELSRSYSAAAKVRLAGKVLYSTEARAQLGKLLDEFMPDVAHVHSVYHHISPAIMPLLHSRSVPIVLTAHDYKLACPAYKMFDGEKICEACKGGNLTPLLRRHCLHGSRSISALVAVESALHRVLGLYRNYVQKIVCPSQFMRRKLLEWGWPAEQLIHIRNFFDPDMWLPEFRPGNYFLYFGRLAPEKGLTTLLRATALAGVALKVVGSGTMTAQLRQLADSLSLEVEFIPHVSPDRLASLIRGARATVLPSEWYENSSLAILESAACGKPVIASDIGGNPEAVRHGDNGWLFAAGDVEALADRMTSVAMMHGAQLEAMGECSRQLVCSEYSCDLYFEAMTALYGSLSIGVRVSDRRSIADATRTATEVLS
jgi:glycosyltransferase involved in cell wall biosynthesis